MVYYFYKINNEMFHIYYVFCIQGCENTLKIMLHKTTLSGNAVFNLEETNRET